MRTISALRWLYLGSMLLTLVDASLMGFFRLEALYASGLVLAVTACVSSVIVHRFDRSRYRKSLWYCTDVGTRTAIAACIYPACAANDYLRGLAEAELKRLSGDVEGFLQEFGAWLQAHPQMFEEHVFDELKMGKCELA